MTIEQEESPPHSDRTDYLIDITMEVCPFTFVHTKLFIDRAERGEILEIRLNAGEPLVNVPRAVEAHGHRILSLQPEDSTRRDGVHRLRIQKS